MKLLVALAGRECLAACRLAVAAAHRRDQRELVALARAASSSAAYSRLTAITTGMRAISSPSPCSRATASSASRTVAPSASSTVDGVAARTLAQHREQPHVDEHAADAKRLTTRERVVARRRGVDCRALPFRHARPSSIPVQVPPRPSLAVECDPVDAAVAAGVALGAQAHLLCGCRGARPRSAGRASAGSSCVTPVMRERRRVSPSGSVAPEIATVTHAAVRRAPSDAGRGAHARAVGRAVRDRLPVGSRGCRRSSVGDLRASSRRPSACHDRRALKWASVSCAQERDLRAVGRPLPA